MRTPRIFILIFLALVYIPYACSCIYIYNTDTDPTRWNFLNTLPFANVSPFMFSVMPLVPLLPKKIREYVYLLISLLSVGMLLSTLLGCLGNAIRNYKFHFHFMLDYFSHCSLSLLGIYLIRADQVKLSIKRALVSASLIFSVATLMLILNVIFDTAFFGLSLNGKHNIYNIVLVESSYLSAVIYYFGLAAVLFSGFMLCRIFGGKRFKIKTNQ
jgi:hypothetical protein